MPHELICYRWFWIFFNCFIAALCLAFSVIHQNLSRKHIINLNHLFLQVLHIICSFLEPMELKQKYTLSTKVSLIFWSILAMFMLTFYNLQLRSYIIGQELLKFPSEIHQFDMTKSKFFFLEYSVRGTCNFLAGIS